MSRLVFLIIFMFSFAHAELIEKTVAIVNDQVITLSDIENYKRQITHGGMVDDLIVTDRKEVIADRAKLIDVMINEKIIDSEVQKQGLSVTVERVESEIKGLAASNKITRSQLKQALKEQGVDFSEYQNFIKKRIERHSLIEKAITSKIKISDEDIAAYYISQKGSQAGQETFQYKLAHILFVPKGGDVDAAKIRAQSVLEKLRSGKSFETLASQYSEDPNFSSGGLLGTFKSGETLLEIEKAAQATPVNGTTDIIKTRIGFHVVKVLEKTLIPSPDFEQNKKKIADYLGELAFKKQFSFWLAQKRQESFIRIN